MSQRGVDYKHVRTNANFAAVAAHYGVTLTGKGEQVAGLCPFHEDTKPSLKVNTGKNVFHCFACDTGGNIFDFVMTIDDEVTKVLQAAKKVAKLSGISVRPDITGKAVSAPSSTTEPAATREDPGEKEEVRQEEDPAELCNKPLNFVLKLDVQPKQPWLSSRGVPEDVAEQLGIGFAIRGMMKERLAFPIHNANGELVAYAGRYPNDDVPDDEPKWKFPGGFHKQLELYNLHRVRPGRGTVMLVESFLSVASHFLVTKGGIVASMGHTLSDEQVTLLCDRGVKRVSIAFDGDEAGRKGAMEAAGKLAAAGIWAKVADMPDGKKPHQMTCPELVAANNRTTVDEARTFIAANSRRHLEEERKTLSWWQRLRAA